MTCARYADADIAERYVLGHMEEAEQASFEEHFFGCDACFASVQVLQQMQTALRGGARQLAAASSTQTSGQAAKFTGPRRAAVGGVGATWWGLAVAATLLLGILWWQRRPPAVAETAPTVARQTDPAPTTTPAPTPAPGAARPTEPPPPSTKPAAPVEPTPAPAPARDLGLLAVVIPPPYVPLQTRGSGDTQAQAFAAAMTPYSAKDYQAAADALRPLAEAQPDAAHVQFFLGISLLMIDKPAEARQALDRAAASGTAPFADEAHFYLAKAALHERDLARAERELQLAVEREAGPAREAARMLRQIRQIK